MNVGHANPLQNDTEAASVLRVQASGTGSIEVALTLDV